MLNLFPESVVTYRNGQKLKLLKSQDEFVVRMLPSEVEKLDFHDVMQVSSASTKVKTQAATLESDMQKCREKAVAHHAYYAEETRSPFFISDRVLVVFVEGTTSEQIDSIIARYGLILRKKYSENEFLFQLTNHTGMNPVKLVVKLTEQESVVSMAEHDLNHQIKKYAFSLPQDPQYLKQWHLHNRLADREFSPRGSSNCEGAWRLMQSFGSQDVVIGISDDGCKMDHPDFSAPGKIAAWGYFKGRRLIVHTDPDANPREMYQPGENHGTNCAGVAAGSANAVLTVGAAPGCRLIPIKWELGYYGFKISDSVFQAALEFIADKVDIFSNSWGSSPIGGFWQMVNNTIMRLSRTGGRRGKGIVFLWAAGNENCPINHISVQDIPYTHGWVQGPGKYIWGGVQTSREFSQGLASLPGVMFVGALSSKGQRSHYSNYGEGLSISASSNNLHTYYRATVEGLDVTTADGAGFTDNFGGTSSACPLVAGIAALVISANPRLSAAEVISILKQTASKDLEMSGYPRTQPASFDPNPSWDISPVAPFDSGAFQDIGSGDGTWSPWYGHGKADAFAAVRKAMELAAGDYSRSIRLVSALVNPAGIDRGKEKLTLLNTASVEVDLEGWLLEVGSRRQVLSGRLGAGEAVTIILDPARIALSNNGATIRLLMADGTKIQEATYAKKDVKEEVAVVF